jgi:4-amino-4-deoxy-L-arabinose transferase-like glycosyltransferase
MLLLIFVAAFLLRVAVTSTFVGLTSPPDGGAQADQLDYEELAFRLSAGHGYTLPSGTPTFHRPPGTSWSLLPVYVSVGRSYAFGRLWFCLLSALTCVATAWLGRLAFNPVVGLLAGLWLAVYPGHFYHSMHFVSEVPYGLFLTVGTAATLRALQATHRRDAMFPWNLLAGLSWAMAILTRPQMLLLAPLALAGLAVTLYRRQTLPAASLAAQVLLVIVLLIPWVVRNAVVAGRPTIASVGAYTFWGAHNERVLADPALRGSWVRTSDLVDADHPFTGTERERESAAWRYGFDFIRRHPSAMPGLEVMKLARLLSPFEDSSNRVVFWVLAAAWICTAPFMLVGLIRVVRRDRRTAMVLLAPILATVVSALVFYGSVRFRDSMAPLLVVLAASGLVLGRSNGKESAS